MGAGMPQSVPRTTGTRTGGLLPPAVVDGLRAAARRTAEAVETLPYDTVSVLLRHGLETVDILRLRGACGAVLSGGGATRLLFLVPAGTAERWHLPGSSCTPGATAGSGARWLVTPTTADGSLRATDPWALRSALCEASGTLMAGGFGPY